MKLMMVPISLIAALLMLQFPGTLSQQPLNVQSSLEDKAAVAEGSPIDVEGMQPVRRRALSALDNELQAMRTNVESMELAILAGSGQLTRPFVDQDDQLRELRSLVEQAFDARHRLQQAEARRLRLKLEEIERNIEVRAINRDAIIERRMRDILDDGRQVVAGSRASEPESTRSIETLAGHRSSSADAQSRLGDLTIVKDPLGSALQQSGSIREIRESLQALREHWAAVTARIEAVTKRIELLSRPIDELIADGILPPGADETHRIEDLERVKNLLDQQQAAADMALRTWKASWEEYQSRLRMLRIEVEKARVKTSAAEQEYQRASQLVAAGNISMEVGREKEAALKLRTLEQEQIEELLGMYASVEVNDSELNPASIQKEVEN